MFLKILHNVFRYRFCTLVLLVILFPTIVFCDTENYTHKLNQSTSGYLIWTTTPSEKVFQNSTAPTVSEAGVKIYAAKNEFEPFQVVVKPLTTGPVAITMNDFGSGITTEIFEVKYVNITTNTDYLGQIGNNPDPLWPLENGQSVQLTTQQNSAFWFSVHVPENVPSGDYTTTVQIGPVTVPVILHVFNFALPAELHVKSQMNFSYNTFPSKYGVTGTDDAYWTYLENIKQFFIDHRLTPKSVLWSGGLTSTGGGPYIDYDCAGTFTDNDEEWGFEQAAARYLTGAGLMDGIYSQPFNDGFGFPSSMTITFTENDASVDQRPARFCDTSRNSADWYLANNPGSVYNQKWFSYISAIENYLSGLNYLDQAYYYIANEPQNQDDYDAVAWYSQELKKVAPNLKLMVSEEPKPEIYDHPSYPGSKIDIWLAHLGSHFNPATSFDRHTSHGEETWIYFLHGTRLPRFNPLTIDHPGIEGKLTGWFLWKYRLRGIAYYQFNGWNNNPWTIPLDQGQNGNRFLLYPPSQSNANIDYGSTNHRFVPSIRLEMLRDGFEDYEYFYLLNGRNQPEPNQITPADNTVDKIIGYTVAYNRDSEFLYNLRRQVGLKLGGEIDSIEDISPLSAHPRSDQAPGNYYINFQDPQGEPIGDITFNDNSYIKIGDGLYDKAKGYGWMKAAEVPDSDFYPYWDQWIDPEPKQLLGSSMIDSWGREDVFEFDLPNGIYEVTACAGSRSNPRYQNIVIEGVVFIDNEETRNSWITRTKRVVVKDKKLTLVMGKFGEIGYINYLDIEAIEPVVVEGDVNCDGFRDLKDVISLLQILSGSNRAIERCPGLQGDLDTDGQIGMGDCLGILKQIVQ